MKEPSKSSQRNLWKSLTQERKYARELRRLIATMGIELKAILDRCTSTDYVTGTQTLDLGLFVDEMDKYISSKIKTTGEAITRDAAQTALDMGIEYSNRTIGAVQGITGAEYVKASIIYTAADWRVLDSLKVRNLSALKGITDEMSKNIIRELSEGINAGESIPKLSKRIQNATGTAKSRATTMARTETINACVDATRIRYQQAGIKRVRFIAAADERTCETCGLYHGNIYDINDTAHMPPIHPNCRCAIAAVYDDE